MKKVKLLFLHGMMLATLGGAMVLSSCGDDESTACTAIENQIKALQNDSITQANAVRNAIEPAKTDPDDITTLFDYFFGANAKKNNWPTATIQDSAFVMNRVVDILREVYGDPIPANNETLSALFDATELFLATCNALSEKRNELLQCQSN